MTPAMTPERRDRSKLDELLKRSKAAMDAMTPTQKAIMFLRQKVSYVASEMTCDLNDNVVRTREEADKIVAQSEPALILAELDRLTAEHTRRDEAEVALREELRKTRDYAAEEQSKAAQLYTLAEKLAAALELIAGMESSARPNHMGSIAMVDAECRAGSMRDHARMQVIARYALTDWNAYKAGQKK